jgi:hypothetical protein
LGEGGGLGLHALADAAFFKDGADDEGSAFDGEDPGEETFGLPPGEAGEVVEGGAGADDEGVDLVFGEELAGALNAMLALLEGNGDGLGAAVFEGGECGRELDVSGRRHVGALGLEGERRGCGCCRGG